MKNCKNCGKSVSDEAAFCMYCGSKFGVVCSNCGREAEDEAVFCSACGTRLNAISAPASTTQQAEIEKACKFVYGKFETFAKNIQMCIDNALYDSQVANKLIKAQQTIVTVLIESGLVEYEKVYADIINQLESYKALDVLIGQINEKIDYYEIKCRELGVNIGG